MQRSKGFSLVEILIACAILAAITMLIMRISLTSSKTSKKFASDIEVTNLIAEITTILSNTENCTKSFFELDPSNTVTGINSIKYKTRAGEFIDRYLINKKMGASLVEIKNYSLSDAAPYVDVAEDSTHLLIRFYRGSSIPDITKKIRLYVETKKDEETKEIKLTSCNALAQNESADVLVWTPFLDVTRESDSKISGTDIEKSIAAGMLVRTSKTVDRPEVPEGWNYHLVTSIAANTLFVSGEVVAKGDPDATAKENFRLEFDGEYRRKVIQDTSVVIPGTWDITGGCNNDLLVSRTASTAGTLPAGSMPFASNTYYPPYYDDWKAFDSDNATGWYGPLNSANEYVGFIFGVPQRIIKYTVRGMTSGDGAKAWVFEVSNDTTDGNNGSWATADSRSLTTYLDGTDHDYMLSTPVIAKAYRIRDTAHQGNGYGNWYFRVHKLRVETECLSLSDDLIEGHMHTKMLWTDPKSRIIGVGNLQVLVPASETAPTINVLVNDLDLFKDPISVNEVPTYAGANEIKRDIQFGQRLKVSVGEPGVGTVSQDLSLQIIGVWLKD